MFEKGHDALHQLDLSQNILFNVYYFFICVLYVLFLDGTVVDTFAFGFKNISLGKAGCFGSVLYSDRSA